MSVGAAALIGLFVWAECFNCAGLRTVAAWYYRRRGR